MKAKSKNITLVLVAFACIVPVIILIVLSLGQQWVYPFVLPKTFNADAWEYILLPGNNITGSILISFLIAFVVAAIATVGGFFTSRLIAYHPYKSKLLLLAYLPFILSPVIFAVCLKYYFIKLGLSGTAFGVILAQLIIAFPYSTILLTSFWNNRLKQYQLLVETLGGTNAFAFSKIIYPLAKPVYLYASFNAF